MARSDVAEALRSLVVDGGLALVVSDDGSPWEPATLDALGSWAHDVEAVAS